MAASSRHRPARGAADLHVHTTHSDGACSPCEVVVAAARVGLGAVAITDHDTVSALPIARPEAAWWGIELIAGVELTCEFEGRELHILGHFIRDDDRGTLRGDDLAPRGPDRAASHDDRAAAGHSVSRSLKKPSSEPFRGQSWAGVMWRNTWSELTK